MCIRDSLRSESRNTAARRRARKAGGGRKTLTWFWTREAFTPKELHRIGGNLNQIAQKAHVLGVIDED